MGKYREKIKSVLPSKEEKVKQQIFNKCTDKNRALLDNWRPISLLNIDYKIATKTVAARIAKVLPSLIHED